ncbi:MAG: hypothetical protein RR603_01380 [Kurthia sp.]
MPSKLRIYSCLQDMYERYSAYAIAEEVMFEERRYQLVGERRKADVYIHLYRSDEEQQNILVYLRNNLPFLIKPIY